MENIREIQQERLFYIEFLAVFTGQVTRKDLVTRFGISEPAATKDISLFAEMTTKVIDYDLRRKCYVYTGGEPIFNHDIDQSLFSLAGSRAIAIDTEHARRLPSWVDTSIKRKVGIEVASLITRSIYQGRIVEADYVSISSGSELRTISPLAIIHDGLRWHIRSYSHKHSEYRDFNLARFKSIKDKEPSDASLGDDQGWQKEVTVKLVAHPKLEHRETVLLDYGFNGDEKHVKLRMCLVGYFLRHWNIDFSNDASGNPRAQQLYLANKGELLEEGVQEWALNA